MNTGSFRSVLKNHSFLALWLAQIFSQFADKFFFLYLVVLVTNEQFSNSTISGLTLIMTIPAVIFGSVAGVFVDRWDKKKIMITTNIFRALFILCLPLSDKLLFYYLITFLVSSLTQFFAPAETAMIPYFVDKKDLLAANSLFTSTMLISVVIGFAIGEPLISRFGEKSSHQILVTLYTFSAFCLFFLKSAKLLKEKKSEDKSFLKEFKEGFRYVIGKKVIFFSLLRLVIIFSAFAALSVLSVGFVSEVLHLPPAFFGYFLAISGIGMGFGALITGKIGNYFGKDKFIFSGFLFTGLALILLGNTQQIIKVINYESLKNSEIIFAFILSFLIGLSSAFAIIPLQTILQESVTENMRGKVFGVQNMAVNMAMTLPMALAGILADRLNNLFLAYQGVSVVMIICGLIVLSGCLPNANLKNKQKTNYS